MKPTQRKYFTRSNHLSRGFTLVELMITVAIVAILAVIGYPSYLDQLRKSHRAAAQAFLMDVATRQQQRFIDVRSYADSVATLGIAVPAEVSRHYTVTVTLGAGPPPTFTLSAAPSGGQIGDSCATLLVTSTGARTPANCW